MDAKLAIRAFLDLLEEVSSVDEQIKLWLNIENDSTMISSYVEFICELNSGDFEYVVNNKINDELLKEKLQELFNTINKYEEPKLYKKWQNDVYIVGDPKWKEIRDFAKNIRHSYSDFLDELKSEV
jgi:N-acetylneuraminic acid mutarotase